MQNQSISNAKSLLGEESDDQIESAKRNQKTTGLKFGKVNQVPTQTTIFQHDENEDGSNNPTKDVENDDLSPLPIEQVQQPSYAPRQITEILTSDSQNQRIQQVLINESIVDGFSTGRSSVKGHSQNTKPITIKVFQVPDQLKQKTRVEINQGRNNSQNLKFNSSHGQDAVRKRNSMISSQETELQKRIKEEIVVDIQDKGNQVSYHGITSIPNSGVTSSMIEPKLKNDPTEHLNKMVTNALNNADQKHRNTLFKFGQDGETQSDGMSPESDEHLKTNVIQLALRRKNKVSNNEPQINSSAIQGYQSPDESQRKTAFFPNVNKEKRFISNQNHSAYTSYPKAIELKVLGNLGDTFNKDVVVFRKNFDKKRSSMVTETQETQYAENETRGASPTSHISVPMTDNTPSAMRQTFHQFGSKGYSLNGTAVFQPDMNNFRTIQTTDDKNQRKHYTSKQNKEVTTPGFSQESVTQQHTAFKYLPQLEKEIKQPSLNFIPYVQERSTFGHILDNDDKYIEPLNLSQRIKALAKKRANDPLAMTTERNLRKIKANTYQKIQNQVRFSKRNELLFKKNAHEVSLEYDMKTAGTTPGLNQSTHSTYRNSSFIDSLPEGVNQISIPLSSFFTQQSINSAGPPTARVYDKTLVTDRLTARGSIISENIIKSKMGPIVEAQNRQEFENDNEMDQQELLKKLKNNYRHFSVNLPNSRSYLPSEQIFKTAGSIRKPITYQRSEAVSNIQPQIYDVIRAQNKEKNKQTLKYSSPAADSILKEDLKIPKKQLKCHVEEFKDFPQLQGVGKIAKNLPTSFGTQKRFKDHQFEYTQEALKLSILDFEQNVYKMTDSAPMFDKYSKRKDNFLTKSQEILIQMKKDEAAQRMQRLQQMKEAQDAENKERNVGSQQHQTAQQMIMFETEDHTRVMQMRPHVKNMVGLIKDHIKSLRDSKQRVMESE